MLFYEIISSYTHDYFYKVCLPSSLSTSTLLNDCNLLLYVWIYMYTWILSMFVHVLPIITMVHFNYHLYMSFCTTQAISQKVIYFSGSSLLLYHYSRIYFLVLFSLLITQIASNYLTTKHVILLLSILIVV